MKDSAFMIAMLTIYMQITSRNVDRTILWIISSRIEFTEYQAHELVPELFFVSFGTERASN